MPKFIVRRTLPPLNDSELAAIGRKVVAACDEIGNMTWIRSHLTSDGKNSFCEFEAPSAEACMAHSRAAGLPFDEVVSLGRELRPTG